MDGIEVRWPPPSLSLALSISQLPASQPLPAKLPVDRPKRIDIEYATTDQSHTPEFIALLQAHPFVPFTSSEGEPVFVSECVCLCVCQSRYRILASPCKAENGPHLQPAPWANGKPEQRVAHGWKFAACTLRCPHV